MSLRTFRSLGLHVSLVISIQRSTILKCWISQLSLLAILASLTAAPFVSWCFHSSVGASSQTTRASLKNLISPNLRDLCHSKTHWSSEDDICLDYSNTGSQESGLDVLFRPQVPTYFALFAPWLSLWLLERLCWSRAHRQTLYSVKIGTRSKLEDHDLIIAFTRDRTGKK